MDYETMVKEAYEEIIGFDKEAGIKDVAGKAWESAKGAGKSVGRAYAATDLRNGLKARGAKREEIYNTLKGFQDRSGKTDAEIKKATNNLLKDGVFNKDIKRGAINTGLAYGIPAAAIGIGGTALALKKRHDKKKEQAEKAAAYYDEAQLVKEAAEADYAEACAYEEAALAILSELGYLD